jgi:hypothetical protein
MGVGTQRLDFAEFYRRSADDCLRAVLVSIGDQDSAKDLVDEAFARALASWRTVSRHPAPAAWVVRTALNANISWWRRHNELITVVRESFTGVHTATPVEQIVSRSRAVRARRRVTGLAGVVALAAGAALAVTTLLSGGHQASPRPPAAQLAAWTVTRQADGSIRVTIRELRNPAGLQSKLREDGVPASVTLLGRQNPSCRRYPASRALAHRVFSRTIEVIPPRQGPPAGTPLARIGVVVVMLIHPSALPSGTGVQLATSFTLLPPVAANGGVEHVARLGAELNLVYASPACTG